MSRRSLLASLREPADTTSYTQPPLLDITLDEFELSALARLRVLSHLEALQHRNFPPAQFQQALATYTKEHLPLASNTARSADHEAERRRDEIGHWVLRLAFARSPELRARFVRAETALFKHRFEGDDAAERAAFLADLRLDWVMVGPEEKSRLGKELMSCLWGKERQMDLKDLEWFKVPWTQVPDLIATRKVYVSGGTAYVPQSLQIALVLQAFASRLEAALELTSRHIPRLDEDDRLGPVVEHLASSFMAGLAGSDYVSNGEAAVTAEMVDGLSRHFPPCMLNLYLHLKSAHHLKHFGRLQLGLFLKGVGLPLEEALIFWRRAYAPAISDDKFNKEYRYNIRHSYGQEGKRANYPPKNCQQILTQNQPGTQDNHGCPFRHFSTDNLTSFLVTHYKLDRGGPEMREIMDSVKKNHYHVACTRLFEVTHGVKKGDGIGNGESVSHPNKYTDRSREIEK